jgi:hypothetical protein
MNFLVLFLALRGSFGEEAREESQVALQDLTYAISKLRYLLIALATIVVAALVWLILQATR